MSLTEIGIGRSVSSFAPVHYLIARREAGGIELPHLALDGREDALPVFTSREAAEDFLVARAFEDGWYVRGFSGGEVISLLFAFGESIKWTVTNPFTAEGDAPDAMSRDEFIELLTG